MAKWAWCVGYAHLEGEYFTECTNLSVSMRRDAKILSNNVGCRSYGIPSREEINVQEAL